VGSTLTVKNFSILVFIFECTPLLAEFSVLNFTIFVRIPKFEKNCYIEEGTLLRLFLDLRASMVFLTLCILAHPGLGHFAKEGGHWSLVSEVILSAQTNEKGN
jgi:hypothetical protein